MVVECGKCGTRFRLDPSRIPDSGIRVRCARCKHAFFLHNPDASPAEVVDAIAGDQVENEGAQRAPEVTQDMPIQDPGASFESAADPAPEPSTPPAPRIEIDGFDDIDEEEDDWQFNEDPPSEDEEPDDLSAETGEDFGDSFDASSLELEEGSPHEADANGPGSIELEDPSMGPSTISDPDQAVRDEPLPDLGFEPSTAPSLEASALQAPPQPAAQTEPQPVPQPAGEEGPAPGFGGERRDDDFGSMDDFSTLMELDEHQPSPPQPVAEADQDDPESWDFFSDGDPGGEIGSTMDQAVSAAEATPMASPTVRGDVDFGAATGEAEAAMLASQASESGGTAARVASVIGWVAALGLGIVGIVQGILFSWDGGIHPPSFVAVGGMRAAEITGSWLDTARLGTVFAVTGHIDNPGVSPAAPGLQIEVVLLDAAGQPLDHPPARAGRDLSLADLREISVTELELAEQKASRSLSWSPITPNTKVPFMAVFRALPDEATHFELRIVAAEPNARAVVVGTLGGAPPGRPSVAVPGIEVGRGPRE